MPKDFPKRPKLPNPDEESGTYSPPRDVSATERRIKRLLDELRVQSALPRTKGRRVVTKPGPQGPTQRLIFELLLQGASVEDIADAAGMTSARIRSLQTGWLTDGSLLRQIESRRRELHMSSANIFEKSIKRVNSLLDSPDEAIQLAAAKLATTMYQNQESNILKQESIAVDSVNAKTNQDLISVLKSYVAPPMPAKYASSVPPEDSTLRLTVDESNVIELDNSSGLVPAILTENSHG